MWFCKKDRDESIYKKITYMKIHVSRNNLMKNKNGKNI